MDKNDKEKQMLYEWAVNDYSKDVFLHSDHRRDSYFLQRTENLCIREYMFETLPELMEELNILWENDEIMESIKRVIAVAAMKNKPTKSDDENGQKNGQEVTDEKLPTYIYNF